MSTQSSCRLGPSLILRTLDRSSIPLQDVHVSAYQNDGQTTAVRITFNLPYEAYLEVDSKHLFNLTGEGRGPTFGGGFRPGAPIQIEATLGAKYLGVLLENAVDIFEIAANLRRVCREDPEHVLAFEGNYFALNVAQPVESVPDAKIGYQTQWTDEA